MKPTTLKRCLLSAVIICLSAWSALAQPVAGFTASVTSGCAPLRVEFNNTSTGSIEWDWTFGDGTTSDAQHPVHFYDAPGTYTVTLSAHGSGATDTETKVGYITVTGFQTVVTVTNATCVPNGSIAVTVTGGTAPITYTWTDGATTQDRTNLAAGAYRVTITDGSGCQFHETYNVGSTGAMTITGTVVNVVPGVHLGSVSTTVSGGTAPLSYLWNNLQATSNLTGVTAGTYCLTVTDANSCSASECFQVGTGPSCALVVTGSVRDASSSTASDGLIEPLLSGGTPPYTYTWSNGETSRIIDGLPLGQYCLTVTDANGCTGDNCFNVEVAPANCSTFTVAGTKTNVSVPGAHDGSITLTLTGGTSPYTFSWSNGATTRNLDNLANGQYCVTVTDVNGCAKDKCFNVEIANACGNFSVVQQITHATCGAANGSINLVVTGGTQPYFFVWTNGSHDEDLYNLVAGPYRVTVEDNGGCRFTETFNVTNSNNNLTITGSVTNVTGPGAQNGAVNITVTGGTPPYTYTWGNGATTEDLANLETGLYCVLVRDANGCIEDGCYNVEGGCTGFTVTGSETQVGCGGTPGAINVTVTGGTPPYHYIWSNGDTTQDISGLTAGTYGLTVEDNGTCRKVRTFTVGYAGGFQISGVATPSTSGAATGSITITMTGGTTPYTFVWSNGATTQNLSNVAPGQYCVIVTTANGCIEDKCFTVGTSGGCGNFYVDAHNDIYLCGPGTTWLEANAHEGELPYSYSWTPSPGLSSPNDRITQATVTDTTTFIVYATDDNGCYASDTVTVFVTNPTASAGVTFDSVTICKGDSVQLTAFGGTTYYWDPGNGLSDRNSATPWAAPDEDRNYVVRITNGNCQSHFTVRVIVDEDCVWPGDANHDGVANNQDVLTLGIGNGISGFPRPNATSTWDGQYCPDWFLALASDPNLKHVDCDGNGTIGAADTMPIFLNYGLTHNKGGDPGQKFVDPELFFDLPDDTAFAGQEIDVPVYLGTSTLQVSNFYGIAFTVDYDNALVKENTMHFAPINSFAGNTGDLLSFDFDMHNESKMDVALTRVNRTTASGFGQIGILSFTMKDDISGKDFLVRELTLGISNVRAIDNNENDLMLFYEASSMFVKQEILSVGDVQDAFAVTVFPNPASETVQIELKNNNQIEEILLTDMVGKQLLHVTENSNKTTLNLAQVAEGNYLLIVKSADGRVTKRITVLR